MSDKSEKQKEDYEELVQQRIEQIRSISPALVNSDGLLDISALKEWLGEKNLAPLNQGYQINFAGKGLARLNADIPTDKELKVENKQSKNFDITQNVIIRGDNLDVLKILRKSYEGRVKMIYIDPPYNTDSANFTYNDSFKESEEELIEKYELPDDVINFFDNVFGTLNHSSWLFAMYPRLKLARDLLTKDGVMFISIDDNEHANLKMICDEIFGEENCIGTIAWNSTKSVTSTALISVGHNYSLIYAKDKKYFTDNRKHFRLPEDGNGFTNPDNDPRGPWKADPFQVGGWRRNQQYTIVNPNTGTEYRPNPGSSWKNDYDKFQELMRDNRIVFGVSGEAGPQRKRFLDEAKSRGKVTTTWWDDVGTTANGTTHVKNLFDNIAVFSNPKPVSLIERFIQLGDHTKEGIILDFFGGSGTTAEAVMEFNKNDGGNRKFILVQWDENIDPKENKPAYDFCMENNLTPVISSICIERVHRAGEKIKREAGVLGEDFDIGYKVFSLTDQPKRLTDENKQLQIVGGRETTPNTLYNMIATSGQALLTDTIEEIEPNLLYRVNNTYYVLGKHKRDLKDTGMVFVDGYADISLEHWLNMVGLNKKNIKILY